MAYLTETEVRTHAASATANLQKSANVLDEALADSRNRYGAKARTSYGRPWTS
jgi:hypothetical protein